MSDFFEQGFTIGEASWHGKETLVMRELSLPEDRDEAYCLAGHNYEVIERPNGNVGRLVDPNTFAGNLTRVNGEWRSFDLRQDKKGLYVKQIDADGKPGLLHGNFLEVTNDSYEVIPNTVGWDLLEAMFAQGLKLDTGFVLKGGAICVVTAYLPEVIEIPGDDSRTFPYVSASWGHGGIKGLAVRSTNVREVCWNTVSASEALATKAGTQFNFRHTKNWREYVEDAKKVMGGLVEDTASYKETMLELAGQPVTSDQRERFATAIAIGATSIATTIKWKGECAQGLFSPRVQTNAENARDAVLGLFNGPTIPEAHKLTGYGLHLAATEYLDHIRGHRSDDSYITRTLLRDEPAKARIPRLVRELIEA